MMRRGRRHGHHSRITLPKLMSRCQLPCMRRYADSDAGSDLQQESLLSEDVQEEGLGAWADEENQENMQVVPALPDPVPTPTTRPTSPDPMPTPSARPTPLTDQTNQASSFLYQMPKLNGRMWQDGFGRFRRDTIPRRSDQNPSPLPNHREAVAVEPPASPAQQWFVSPMLSGLGAGRDITDKSSDGSSCSDDEENEEIGWQRLEDEGATGGEERPIRPSRHQQRQSDHSPPNPTRPDQSHLAQILLSLPNQSSPYMDLPPTDTIHSLAGGLSQTQSQNQSESHMDGHPSVFDILERLENNQDRAVQPHCAEIDASQSNTNEMNDGNANDSDIEPRPRTSTQRSNESSGSSTWSDRALIQHILQALTDNSPPTTTRLPLAQSAASTTSSGTSQNWYHYDRRLVINRRIGAAVEMMRPPSYEEAQRSVVDPDLPGININLLTQLGFLPSYPTDPPPPYTTDITPPPSYITGSMSDAMSDVNSITTSDISSANTESDIVEMNDRNITDEGPTIDFSCNFDFGNALNQPANAATNVHRPRVAPIFPIVSLDDSIVLREEARPRPASPRVYTTQMDTVHSDPEARDPNQGTRGPNVRLGDSIQGLRDPNVNHRDPNSHPTDPNQGTRDSITGPRYPNTGPRDPNTDPRDPNTDPRDPNTGPRDPNTGPRDPNTGPREDATGAAWGFGGRPAVRWNRGMGLDRWASSQNWPTCGVGGTDNTANRFSQDELLVGY